MASRQPGSPTGDLLALLTALRLLAPHTPTAIEVGQAGERIAADELRASGYSVCTLLPCRSYT
jgi:hypothetical protein